MFTETTIWLTAVWTWLNSNPYFLIFFSLFYATVLIDILIYFMAKGGW